MTTKLKTFVVENQNLMKWNEKQCMVQGGKGVEDEEWKKKRRVKGCSFCVAANLESPNRNSPFCPYGIKYQRILTKNDIGDEDE
jgi:hypothetical protein